MMKKHYRVTKKMQLTKERNDEFIHTLEILKG